MACLFEFENRGDSLYETKVKPLVYGVGVYSAGRYKCTNDRVMTQEYSLWSNMLGRVYAPKSKGAKRAYSGYIVSENFKNFQYFAEWCNNQSGFNTKGWQLDKDLLSKNDLIYSEDTCAFLPRHLNVLLTDKGASRGTGVLGVQFHKGSGKYRAQVGKWGNVFHLGYFETEGEAFSAYKLEKGRHIREAAEFYKDVLDDRVYLALMNWGA